MSASDRQVSTSPPFTGMALDRATAERKDPARVGQLLSDPATRMVAAGRNGVLISDAGDGGEPSLARLKLSGLPEQEPILLGLEHRRALFALDLDALGPEIDLEHTSAGRVVSLREAGAVLSHSEGGLAAYVTALLNWHRKHHFCANCGTRTIVVEAGYSRRCPHCGTMHFPRTDPVVIMTVEHDGRLLLGRRAGWPSGRLSVLAGFISPGESAEEAVVREVQEESGIVARDPVFVASQPWPFPASLMLGFHAWCDGGEPRPSDGELEEVYWLDLDDVRAAMNGAGRGFQLPPSVSIARYLIERWVAARGG